MNEIQSLPLDICAEVEWPDDITQPTSLSPIDRRCRVGPSNAPPDELLHFSLEAAEAIGRALGRTTFLPVQGLGGLIGRPSCVLFRD